MTTPNTIIADLAAEVDALRRQNNVLLDMAKKFLEYEEAIDSNDLISGMLIYAEFSAMARVATSGIK